MFDQARLDEDLLRLMQRLIEKAKQPPGGAAGSIMTEMGLMRISVSAPLIGVWGPELPSVEAKIG